MVLKVAEIIFNDSASRYNKELTDFLKRSIPAIITRGQIKFRFKIARASDLGKLRSKGIKKLPAMVIDDRSYISVPVIVGELQKRVKKSSGFAAVKSEEEVLDEYYKKTLGNIHTDGDKKIDISKMDQEDTEGENLEAALHKELDRRKSQGMGGSYMDDDGGKKKPGRRDPPPAQPSRNAEQDDDYEDRRPPTTYNPVGKQRPRQDNVEADIGDPFSALQRIQGQGGGEGAGVDDKMMSDLLARMGNDD